MQEIKVSQFGSSKIWNKIQNLFKALKLILQSLVQVDWEPGPIEIVPNWAPHFLRPTLSGHMSVG